MRRLLIILFLLIPLAGCTAQQATSVDEGEPTPSTGPPRTASPPPTTAEPAPRPEPAPEREPPQTAAAPVGPILVEADGPGGEPMLTVAPDGAIYLQAVAARAQGQPESWLWRSDDGGRTWTKLGIPDEARLDSFDATVAAGSDGEVFLANAYRGTLAVWRSDDQGESWDLTNVPKLAPVHRMWLTPMEGTLELGVDTIGGPNLYWKEGDATPTIVSRTYDVGGSLARGPNGELVWPRHESAPADRYVAWRLEGTEWTSAPMTPDASPETFPITPARRTSVWTPTVFDEQGTVFHVWSQLEGDRSVVRAVRSADGGATWSSPVTLSPSGTNVVFPWVTAWGDGRLAVAAYLDAKGGEDWRPLALDVTWPASERAPTRIERIAVPDAPLHKGRICTYGQACPPEETALGEFPAVARAASGLVFAFASSEAATDFESTPVVFLAPSP